LPRRLIFRPDVRHAAVAGDEVPGAGAGAGDADWDPPPACAVLVLLTTAGGLPVLVLLPQPAAITAAPAANPASASRPWPDPGARIIFPSRSAPACGAAA